MVARFERAGDLALCPTGSDRHSVSKCLGECHHVGLYPLGEKVLKAEPFSRSTEPGLDLIDHEQDAALITKPTEISKITRRSRVDATLPLHRFQHYRGNRRIDHALKVGHISPRRMPKPLGQWLKSLVLRRLPGHMQSRQRPTVKRTVGTDNNVTTVPGPLARHLDGALVGLGSGIGEKDLTSATQ